MLPRSFYPWKWVVERIPFGDSGFSLLSTLLMSNFRSAPLFGWPVENNAFSKPYKPTITTVMLSRVFLKTASLIMFSVARPQKSWIFENLDLSLAVSHTHSIISSLLSLSNIPSPILYSTVHPSIMKSLSFVSLNDRISGVEMIARGLPPYSGSLASISPNVLVTESLPGNTRCGPIIKANSCPSYRIICVGSAFWSLVLRRTNITDKFCLQPR